MTSLVILALLVVGAGIPYLLWARTERRAQQRASAVAADVAALGDDAVPASIHPEIDLHECIGSGACVRACPEHEVLGITDGRARLINPLACIGHGACLAACPVGAISLVFGTATRGVELPRLSPVFETSQAEVYITGELGGMGLIRNAVTQGRQVAEAIARAGRRGSAGVPDVVVVGAGPTSIATALAAQAHGLSARLLEQERFGGTIRHYPRAKVVMTGPLDFPGFGAVRRKTMSKEELLALWDDIRVTTQLDVEEGRRVTGLERCTAGWRVRGDDWHVDGASVVLALGRRGAPRRLGVPGEDLAKVSYRLLEPEPFADQHVLVVGGGNAAADCALALVEFGRCASVALSYRRRELARMRASVRARVETTLTTKTLRSLLGTELAAIEPTAVVLRPPADPVRIANDAVIVQIGGTAPSELLRSIGIDLVEKRGER